MIDKDKKLNPIIPKKSDITDNVIVPDKVKKDAIVKDDEYYEQPPSDSDFDICGPLNCDKEL